ncbi:MAG: hypothetical protein WD844_10250 [Thermoleophilaceae bacterium]
MDGPAQHLLALEHANRVRLARAEMKRRVATGETSAADVVLDNPWHTENMAVSELLMSQRRWGRARCRRLLLSLDISENKRLGTFTERQRRALAAMLNANTAPPPPSTHSALASAAGFSRSLTTA